MTLILVFCLSGCRQSIPLLTDALPKEIKHNLDRLLPGLMEEYEVTGLSVIAIQNGKITVEKSYGYADIESGKKIQKDSVFRAASLGKPVFSYIVLALVRQGKIELDVPLTSYINEKVVTGDSRSEKITARMVLSHTSGLPNINETKKLRFLSEPGEGFKYSGTAFLYLQKVIENITGRNLNSLAREMVFEPLHMQSSSFVWQTPYSKTLAKSYDKKGGQLNSKPGPYKAYAAWSLFTTASDYARFVSHIIDESKTTDSIAAEMLKPVVDVTKAVKWGLGWGIQDTKPDQSFWHWGSTMGYRHFVVAYPRQQLAVIVMSNSSGAFKILDDVILQTIGGSLPAYDWF